MSANSHIRRPRPAQKFERPDVIGKCPACGRDILVGTSKYFCTNLDYMGRNFDDTMDNQCSFVIYRNRMKKLGKEVISPDEMRTLLEGGAIPLNGLIRKDGETFDTYGVLANQIRYGWGISFVSLSALAKPAPSSDKPAKRQIVLNSNS